MINEVDVTTIADEYKRTKVVYEHSPVAWNDKENILEAIKVGSVLRDEHGREFVVRKWSPVIEVGEVVKVVAEMVVYIKKEEITQ